MLDLSNVMHRLAQTRPVFHSEADFQHALAWQLHTDHPDARIRPEYPFFAGKKMYLDIWYELNRRPTAIELKYPTKRTSITTTANERFDLVQHGAQDVTRYDIVKDVVRVEQVIDAVPKSAAAAIVLTNDPSFWNPSPKVVPTIDAAFRIHEGQVLHGSCAWAENAGPGTTRGRTEILKVRGRYPIKWQDYSTSDERLGRFRFVIFEATPTTP